jgi:hypothetical protein
LSRTSIDKLDTEDLRRGERGANSDGDVRAFLGKNFFGGSLSRKVRAALRLMRMTRRTWSCAEADSTRSASTASAAKRRRPIVRRMTEKTLVKRS